MNLELLKKDRHLFLLIFQVLLGKMTWKYPDPASIPTCYYPEVSGPPGAQSCSRRVRN